MDSEVNKKNATEETTPASKKTSTGLDENLGGLLCYLFGLITGVLFFIIEKDSKFIRFHALQSIFISAAFFILHTFLALIPILGWFISLVLVPIGLILWILLMYKAYQGELYKLPIIGNMAEKQVNNN